MSNLAGLYPPTGKQVWNKNIPWQPIPVHVIPGDTDYITGGSLPPCKVYDQAYNAYLQSDEMSKVNKSLEPLYHYLSSSLGVTVDDVMTVMLMRDSLLCESIHNLTYVFLGKVSLQWINLNYILPQTAGLVEIYFP